MNPVEREKIIRNTDLDEYKARMLSALHSAWKMAAEAAHGQQEAFKKQYDKRARPQEVKVGQQVLLKNFQSKVGLSKKLTSSWLGVFRVIEVEHPHATIVSVRAPTTRPKRVHLNQIKPFYSASGPALTHSRMPAEEMDALRDADARDHIVTGYSKSEDKVDEVTAEVTSEAPPAPRYNLRSRARN